MAENLTEHAPLVISPQELIFPPPLNRVITNILKLHNSSAKPVSYKIKTTARKRYCVRPNTGVVNPKETVEVQILLNVGKDQPIDPKTKDKFQVQSIYLEPEQITQDLKAVWSLVTEESIMKQKLKCYFSSKPGANAAPLGDSTQPRFAPTIPRSLSKDDSQDEYDEPKPEVIPEIRSPIIQQKAKQQDIFVSALPIEETHVIPTSNQSDSREKRQEEAIKTVSRQLGAVTSERDEYKKEIAQLREKINQMEALRQRKTVVSDTGVTTKQMEVFEQQTNLRLIQLLIVAIVFFLLGRYSS